MSEPIHTDENGRIIEKPDRPGADAPWDEVERWLSAYFAWKDRITACANRAFDDQLRKSLKEKH